MNNADFNNHDHMTKSNLINKASEAIVWLYIFIRQMYRQFVQGRGMQTASSLAYTTLLSIVPLIAVMFSFFGNFPVFKDISEIIQEFVFSNFVPGFGQTVRDYLINFSIKASQLTVTGIIILVVIALMLMATIDTALNNIWHIRSKRKPVARFLIYWTILTLGPILLGVGLYSTSYLLSLSVFDTFDESLRLKGRLLTLMPFFTTSIAFTLLYILVPHCFVSRRHAIIGGITAALLFELAKNLFGLYVKAIPTYQMIYGALAVIPMFFIWVYFSWVIVLLGAQIAYSLSVFRFDADRMRQVKTEWDFFDAYYIIAELWHAQNKGNYLSAIQIRQSGAKISQFLIDDILELLQKSNWVYRNSSGQWFLTRDMSDVTLLDFYQLLACKLPEKIQGTRDKWQLPLDNILKQQARSREENMAISLGALFQQAKN